MQRDLLQELPKILGNGPQQTKILTTVHFSYCLHSSMLTNITKQDKNNWVHLHVTLIIPSNYNISHSLICTKTWRKGLKRLKILRIDHFSYVWALLPANFDSKRTKAIRHGTIKHTMDHYKLQYGPQMDHNGRKCLKKDHFS